MSQTSTEPGSHYFAARRVLVVAMSILLATEFAGLSVSSTDKVSLGGFSLALRDPPGLVYLLVFLVVYAMYEHQLEWLAFRETGRPSFYRLLDYRLLSSASLWVLIAFYAGEAIRHWRAGWVPHALATGLGCLAFVSVYLYRRWMAPTDATGAGPRWAVRVLGIASLFLVIAEPVSHQVPFIHWLAVMLLPIAIAAFVLVNVLGSRPIDAGDQTHGKGG